MPNGLNPHIGTAEAWLLQRPHVAALVGRFHQDLAQRSAHPGMIVGDHKLDPVEATFLQSERRKLR